MTKLMRVALVAVVLLLAGAYWADFRKRQKAKPPEPAATTVTLLIEPQRLNPSISTRFSTKPEDPPPIHPPVRSHTNLYDGNDRLHGIRFDGEGGKFATIQYRRETENIIVTLDNPANFEIDLVMVDAKDTELFRERVGPGKRELKVPAPPGVKASP